MSKYEQRDYNEPDVNKVRRLIQRYGVVYRGDIGSYIIPYFTRYIKSRFTDA